MKLTVLSLAIMATLLFAGFSAKQNGLPFTTPGLSTGNAEVHISSAKFQAQVNDIVRATNKARKRKGYRALKKNQKLMNAAQAYAELMAKEDKMSHSVRNLQLSDRAKKAGYSYKKLRENIALNSQLEGTFVVNEQWMKSAGHRKNILADDVSEMGVAVAGPSRKGLYYYCQIFGTPLQRH